MSAWSDAELDRIGSAAELQLASQRPDGSLRPFIVMWVVRWGDGLYVRSAYGPENGWFRRAQASGGGRIRAGGVERDVSFDQPGTEVDAPVSAAYHAKYDRYGTAIVGTVVSSVAARCTLRLLPR